MSAWTLWRFVIVAAAVGGLVAPLPASTVERIYSGWLYPRWQPIATSITNAVPIAVFDLILLAGTIGLVVAAWYAFTTSAGSSLPLRAGRVLATIGVGACVLYLWFLAGWGLNYRREPLTAQLAFDRSRVTAEAVRALAERTVSELNALHPIAWQREWPATGDLAPALAGPFRRLDELMPWKRVSRPGVDVPAAAGRFRFVPGIPKRSVLQPYFRWAGVDGMTNPFLPEVLVNADLLPPERAFVVAHEWAHLAGLAHEAEASFAAWRVCLSGDEQARYSAWIWIYGHVMRALPREMREPIAARLDGGPRRDLHAIAARYERTVPAVRTAAWSAYDQYLKSNAVAEGIASYEDALVLVLGTGSAPATHP